MEAQPGDVIVVESERVAQPGRRAVVEEGIRRRDDCHLSREAVAEAPCARTGPRSCCSSGAGVLLRNS
jgi:hypothetical protein